MTGALVYLQLTSLQNAARQRLRPAAPAPLPDRG